jgi:hypothetical protein
LRKRTARSGSLYVEPRISDVVIEKSEKLHKGDSAIYLKDRGILRHMIQSGEIGEARLLLANKYPQLYEKAIPIKAYLDILEFIELIKDGDLPNAIEFASTNLSRYVRDNTLKIKIPTKSV